MGSFQDALRSRLSAIDESGEGQTTWTRMKNQRDRAKAQAGQELDWQKSLWARSNLAARNQQGLAGNVTQTKGGAGASGDAGYEKFVSSIMAKESSNNYNARNKHSGAMGAYQIMPANLGGTKSGWDYEALGHDVTPQQFMASPQIQDQIARTKLQQYYNRYGAAGASVAWYAGEGAANKYAKSGQASTRTEANGYPSVQAYVNAITGR